MSGGGVSGGGVSGGDVSGGGVLGGSVSGGGVSGGSGVCRAAVCRVVVCWVAVCWVAVCRVTVCQAAVCRVTVCQAAVCQAAVCQAAVCQAVGSTPFCAHAPPSQRCCPSTELSCRQIEALAPLCTPSQNIDGLVGPWPSHGVPESCVANSVRGTQQIAPKMLPTSLAHRRTAALLHSATNY